MSEHTYQNVPRQNITLHEVPQPCEVCFIPMGSMYMAAHEQFHKRHHHHAPYCSIMRIPVPDWPLNQNMCNCRMAYVYV